MAIGMEISYRTQITVLLATFLILLGAVLVPQTVGAADNDTSDGCPRGSVFHAGRGDCFVRNPAPGAPNFVPPVGPTRPAAGANTDGDECSGIISPFLNFGKCIGRGLAVWVGGFFIWLTGWVLGASGVLFNWLIEGTVVKFNENIFQVVAPGVQAVWTVFRDIANIIIIGIFVFVAIEMILNTTTFGGRRTVAKILIVAVLINFSMLFARLVVEAGNFVSGQFYKAVQIETGSAATTIGSATSTPGSAPSNQISEGISGQFARLMGVAGTTNTGEALWKIATDANNGWIALLHAIFTSLIFLAAAFVFGYASFLLISRAILLVFLIMTSSLAFASFIIPKSFLGNYGWTTWWQSLIKAAVFGPILIIFLWATLKIGASMAGTTNNGQLGTMLVNPANGGSVKALFGYLMILGMLYASIKIATSFAKGIAGFNYASMIPALGFGIAGRVTGALGRASLGQIFQRTADLAQKGSQSQSRFMPTRTLDFVSQQLRRGARADYNPLKAGVGGMSLGSEMQQIAGFKKLETVVGKDIGGFEGALKKRAERIAEQAERMTPKLSEQTKRAREEVLKESAGLAHTESERQLQDAQKQLLQSRQEQAKASEAFTKQVQEIGKQINRIKETPDSPEKTKRLEELEVSRKNEESRRDSEMRSQAERIKQAQAQVSNLEQIHRATKGEFEKAIAAKIRRPVDTGVALAESSFTARATGSDALLAEAVRKKIGDKSEMDSLKKQLAALKAIDTPPSPPPAAGGSH